MCCAAAPRPGTVPYPTFKSIFAVLMGMALTTPAVFAKNPGGSKGGQHSAGHAPSGGHANRQPASRSSGHHPPATHQGHTPTRKTSPAYQPAKRTRGASTRPTTTRTARKAASQRAAAAAKRAAKRAAKGPRRPGQPRRPGNSLTTRAPRNNLTVKAINKYNGARKPLKRTVLDPKYHRNHGKRFTYEHGGFSKRAWFYPGKRHHHWQFCRWNSSYRKWFFFDPCTRDYYCYSPECACYVPTLYYCSSGEWTPDQEGELPSGEETPDDEEAAGATADEPGDGD
jgi:hypothetical protein